MTSTDDDTMLGEAWMAAPRKRSRFRLVTAAALVGALCFLGGAMTQKTLGAVEGVASAGGLPAGMPEGMGGGLPAGFPGAGQEGAGQEGAAPGGAGSDAGSGTGADDQDQVIGTVVEKNGDVWVVEDLGGTRHDVTVTEDTQIVREAPLTPGRVTKGDRVQIVGVSRDDQLQAADITLR